jgi:hypothetical protein
MNQDPKIGDIYLHCGIEKTVVALYGYDRNITEIAFLSPFAGKKLSTWFGMNGLIDYQTTLDKDTLIEWHLVDSQLLVFQNKNIHDPSVNQTKNVKDTSVTNFIQQSKGDLEKAALRVAGHQTTRLLKKVILTLVKREGSITKKSELNVVERFFSTKLGEAFISMTAGQFLTHFPKFKDVAKVKILAEELRVAGFATAGNELVDFVQENYIGDFMGVINSLPGAEEVKAPKVRIHHHANDEASFEADLEEHDAPSLQKQSV